MAMSDELTNIGDVGWWMDESWEAQQVVIVGFRDGTRAGAIRLKESSMYDINKGERRLCYGCVYATKEACESAFVDKLRLKHRDEELRATKLLAKS